VGKQTKRKWLKESTTANSVLPQLAVTCKIEAECSYQTFVQVDSGVLQNRQLRQHANRWFAMSEANCEPTSRALCKIAIAQAYGSARQLRAARGTLDASLKKVSGCFRTLYGAEIYDRIQSFYFHGP
jgi:hypothetical protein